MTKFTELVEAVQHADEDGVEFLPTAFMVPTFELYLASLYEVRPDSCRNMELDPRGYRHQMMCFVNGIVVPEGELLPPPNHNKGSAIAKLIQGITHYIGTEDVIITWRRRITFKDGRADCRIAITQV